MLDDVKFFLNYDLINKENVNYFFLIFEIMLFTYDDIFS